VKFEAKNNGNIQKTSLDREGVRQDSHAERHVSGDSIRRDFIGQSPAFNSILEMIQAIAARKCPVIITGETGVGKEMIARQIYFASDRVDKVFVPVDCTTLTGCLAM